MITKQIPEIVSKYQEVPDKGLFWEMIKMEIRASTIIFAKRKAKQKRDEENDLLIEFTRLQEKIRSNFSEATKIEMDRVKKKLAKVVANKTRGTMVRSKAQWYEFGEKNSKYFYNLEKRNHKRKHIISLKKEDVPMSNKRFAHLFFTCSAATSFWSEVTTWYNSLSKTKKTSLSKTEIIYGVTENWSSCSTLNHLIIIGKYFLYTNVLTDQRFQFADYITLVRDKIETENTSQS